MNGDIFEKVKRIVTLAQAGITYCENNFDLERYQDIKLISEEIISLMANTSIERVKDFYPDSDGYLTPKVDVRGVVLKDNKILLVKENVDGKWSIPGGWADFGYTPSEVAVKEVKEEAGYDVEVVRLLGVHDKRKHSPQKSFMEIYKIFFHCKIVGGDSVTGIETTDVGFFDLESLPPLSVGRNTEAQIRKVVEMIQNPIAPCFWD